MPLGPYSPHSSRDVDAPSAVGDSPNAETSSAGEVRRNRAQPFVVGIETKKGAECQQRRSGRVRAENLIQAVDQDFLSGGSLGSKRSQPLPARLTAPPHSKQRVERDAKRRLLLG
jgi:hypothetical protein